MDARYAGLRVPKAKIREGRSPAARLLLLAEAPERMRGTIQVAGNPLIELAINEQGYALRNLRGQPGLPEGFYHGPPSRCAVRSLLGVDLEAQQVVNLLLGGGPLIEAPHEIVSQSWKKGRERLVLRNHKFEQRLEFAWVKGKWWFAGSSLYYLQGENTSWLWTIRHERLEPRSGSVVPEKTQIKRPVPGDTIELNISYAKQVIEALAEAKSVGDGDGDGDMTDGSDESGDEDWDDEGGWEDDEEGWEGEEGEEGEGGEAAKEHQPAEPVVEAPTNGTHASTPTATPASEVKAAAPEPIPAAYLLEAGGLVDRGDLCKR
jgi:hypothetical protein